MRKITVCQLFFTSKINIRHFPLYKKNSVINLLLYVSLPRWPRCRKYSTLVNHGLPSSQSSTSQTHEFGGEILNYDRIFFFFLISRSKYKILRKVGRFRQKQSKHKVVSPFPRKREKISRVKNV